MNIYIKFLIEYNNRKLFEKLKISNHQTLIIKNN